MKKVAMKKSANNDSWQTSSLALAISLALPATAMAREELLIEEVKVTAQKREQSLQDVPVSVSLVSGEAIVETGITNLDELSTHVPNLMISEGSQTTAITMRGLGSGINQGFEQSVGLFIDSIYAGRDRQFRSPFLALGEYTLTSITGYSEYQYHDDQDVDFSPLELLTQEQNQDFDQWSQEIRLTSPLGDKFDFITGLYYQNANLKHHQRLDSDLGAIIGGVPTLGTVNGMPLPVNPLSVANLLAPATFVNVGSGLIPTNIGASIIAAGLSGGRSARVSDFDQNAQAWAIFGQTTPASIIWPRISMRRRWKRVMLL